MEPRPGVYNAERWDELQAVSKPNGSLALFEFKGALPRARLYSRWQVVTNGQATLDQLSNPAFNPEQTVLVDSPLSQSPPADTADNAGSVEIESYAPKRMVLKANAAAESVLLLTDRYDVNWRVSVD